MARLYWAENFLKFMEKLDNNIVLTEQDYHEYETKYPAAFNLLKTIFYTRPILFIGCSLKDTNFRRVYHLARSMQNKKMRHFALIPESDRDESRMWDKFDVTMIPFIKEKGEEKSEALFRMLRSITEKIPLVARDIDGRMEIFDSFEANYLNKDETRLKKSLTIRKEITTGFISIPDNPNVYHKGKRSPDDVEKRWNAAKKTN